MHDSGRVRSWQNRLSLDHLPDVDHVRPKRCHRCRAPAICRRLRVVVQGHGIRTRSVVVLATLTGDTPRLGECWERRYRCTACRSVMVVLPKGVLPRYLYCPAAIVAAFFLVTPPPSGEGKTQAEAYDRQGMFVTAIPRDRSEPSYRWVSLERWKQKARDWWPAWTTSELTALLVVFLERSGNQGLEAALDQAVCSHVQWGATM